MQFKKLQKADVQNRDAPQLQTIVISDVFLFSGPVLNGELSQK